MKKLGILSGGFKPFHNGHFSKLSLALKECDHVYVIFGQGERKKGGNIHYTRDICNNVYEIVKCGLNEMFENVTPVMSKTTPIRDVFNIVGAFHIEDFESDEYDKAFIRSFDSITVYTSDPDVETYTKYIGTDREIKYFGNMISNNQLIFETDSCFDKSVIAVKEMCNIEFMSNGDIISNFCLVRGTDVREYIAENNFKDFLMSCSNGILDYYKLKEIYTIIKEGQDCD